MNISDAQQEVASPTSGLRNHRNDSEDDHMQDVLSNTSLHITDGRYHDHPYVGKVGAVLASLEIFIMISLVVVTFVLPHVLGEEKVEKGLHIGIYALIVYAHCSIWLVVFLFDLTFSYHHRKLKMRGYLKFYRSIKYTQRHPFCVVSLFQAIILVLTNYLSYSCSSESIADCKLWTLSPMMWMQILTSVETAIILIGLIIYLSKIYYQNKHRLAPDDADNQMLTSFEPHSLDSTTGVGYRADNFADDIIENQADRIRSLQEQNAVLNKKLYLLSHKQPGTGIPRV